MSHLLLKIAEGRAKCNLTLAVKVFRGASIGFELGFEELCQRNFDYDNDIVS